MKIAAIILLGAFVAAGCVHTRELSELEKLPDTYQPGLLGPALKIDGNWWWYTGSTEDYDWLAFRPQIGAVHSWYRVPRGQLDLAERFPRTLESSKWLAVDHQLASNPAALPPPDTNATE